MDLSRLFQDPEWPRAYSWLQSGEEEGAHVQIIGMPINQSVTPGSCELAPRAFREATAMFSLAPAESGPTQLESTRVCDLGDLEPESDRWQEVLNMGCRTVILGGDNGATRVGVEALRSGGLKVGVITLDAHHDLRSTDNGFHNGNPIRALLESGFAGSDIYQFGIQSFANSPLHHERARSEGIHIYSAESLIEITRFEKLFLEALEELSQRVDCIYVDIDLDVMDRAFAPGCPGARPGGLTPHHVRLAARLAGACPKVKAVDLVEMDPKKDVNNATALAGAAAILEFCYGVAQNSAVS